MKVLLVNHGTAGNWGGGDGVQMRETARLLVQRGHKVEMVNSDQPNVAGFDLVHLFNCRVAQSFEQQMNCCKSAGIPVVVSPIWVSISRALWGSRGTLGVLREAVDKGTEANEHLFELLKRRELVVQLNDGNIHADGHGTTNQSAKQTIIRILSHADGLLPNSWLELQAVRADLQWSGNEFEIAHYGVNPKIFLDADPTAFHEHTGINFPFVLQAGRIEPAKNQAMLCWALKETNMPVVLIGGSQHWPSYKDLCKEILGDRLTIIDHLPQEILASAYSAAAVHVLPSWMETCGLVSLEAALSGTPIVGSTFGHELEYIGNDGWYADPGDPETIQAAVINASNAGRYSRKAIAMKKKVLELFNWEQAVDATEKIYKSVLENKN